VLDTLRRVADEGIAQDKVEAALHTLELHQREISGDSYPYGLQLILSALSSATHRGDPIELLDIDPVLDQLKEDIKDPDYIPRLIREYLLDNPHRLTLTVHPDANLSAEQNAREKARLASIHDTLTPAEKQQIVSQAQALQQRQNQHPDASILPKVELSDVPADIKWPTANKLRLLAGQAELPVSFYAQGTNGISYQQVLVALPALSMADTELLSLYTNCLSEVGLGKRSYLDVQAEQAAVSGGISAYTSMRSKPDNEQDVQGYLVLSSKALYRKQGELTRLLHETLHDCRFDELSRIRELMEQILGRREQSITSQGHSLAMGAACSRMCPLSALSHRTSGLAGIRSFKQLVKELEQPARLADFAASLDAVHKAVLSGNRQILLVAEAAEENALLTMLQNTWGDSAIGTADGFGLPPVRDRVGEAWLASTQVNFCAMAFPTVASLHPDAAALTVLGGFLRNGYLHRTIREQGGAYGGGATQDSGSASFRFYSYRDPRLTDTLDDFRRAIDWMLTQDHDYSQLEEAILGVISSLDKPASPAGSAKQAFHSELFGRDREQRARFRREILAVGISDLKRVTERYLDPGKASIGVVSNKTCQGELEKLGLEIRTL